MSGAPEGAGGARTVGAEGGRGEDGLDDEIRRRLRVEEHVAAEDTRAEGLEEPPVQVARQVPAAGGGHRARRSRTQSAPRRFHCEPQSPLPRLRSPRPMEFLARIRVTRLHVGVGLAAAAATSLAVYLVNRLVVVRAAPPLATADSRKPPRPAPLEGGARAQGVPLAAEPFEHGLSYVPRATMSRARRRGPRRRRSEDRRFQPTSSSPSSPTSTGPSPTSPCVSRVASSSRV